MLQEIGITPPSYPTLNWRLPIFATQQWRQRLAAACAAHVGLGPATLVLYDLTALHFETDTGDGSARPGSPRSASWSRRSPSGCSPMRAGSH